MTPLQTNDGIVLVQSIDDLKELLIDKCGYEVWDFIKYTESFDESQMQAKIDDLESDNDDLSREMDKLTDELNGAEERIDELEKELKTLKPDPVIIPIASLKKTRVPETFEEFLLEDEDDECIPF